MTCIVGIKNNGNVYLGGDSAGVGGWASTERADKKVFVNGDFIMGFTTSFRMGQILQYAFVPPKRHPDQDVMSYMVVNFIDAVRYTLKSGGYASKESDAEIGGCFLVGYAGRLFRIDNDYQVGESLCEYEAVGCGEEYAKGALFASKEGFTPEERLHLALNAASYHSAGVRPPFNWVSN